jgi:hypothetical protein
MQEEVETGNRTSSRFSYSPRFLGRTRRIVVYSFYEREPSYSAVLSNEGFWTTTCPRVVAASARVPSYSGVLSNEGFWTATCPRVVAASAGVPSYSGVLSNEGFWTAT